MTPQSIRSSVLRHVVYSQGQNPEFATLNDWYMAFALTVRDALMERWIDTQHRLIEGSDRVVCYLSAEFLTGPHLGNNLLSLGALEAAREAAALLKIDFDSLLEIEEEPGLGNGGLGRLAACYMDSLSTLQVPAIGYGIRYEFGIFDQTIVDGWQKEITDKWLLLGNPWELPRPEYCVRVRFGGHTESFTDELGRFRKRWIPAYEVRGVPYNTPVLGYGSRLANVLRLWSAEAVESFDFEAFNQGDYIGAVEDKVESETISKVLYPNDEGMQGKRLRLMQQYFFVACSLSDMFRLHKLRGRPVRDFHQKFAVQMNDTHPAIAVAELMRILVDDELLPWEEAWDVTRQTLAYTNHTLLPEALERWPLPLFAGLLPRHLEIIYEINHRFLSRVRAQFPGDSERAARMSIIEEGNPQAVRMAHLAAAGSHTVNGVAELHSRLLRESVLRDFFEMDPAQFTNVTNGVTPRRWLALSHPPLAQLITSRLGEQWIADLNELRQLEPLAEEEEFREQWRAANLAMKANLSRYILCHTRVQVDPASLFDVQVKRIHEYKRQHLLALYIITQYQELKRNPSLDIVPRTFIFGGKAAPGYFLAKLIIKFIHSIGEVVNNDPDVGGRLKVVFLPDYNVKFGQHVYPAADLSEQISTAGKEASGTGNMKFAMNGAVTIGTYDGANIEIREAVGEDNFFLFGLRAEEVAAWRSRGYRPWEIYESDSRLRAALDSVASGVFSGGDTALFRPLVDNLLHSDPYFVLADFAPYYDCQRQVSNAFSDPERWTRMSILNSARIGRFSSDRSIREYCERIWRVPLP